MGKQDRPVVANPFVKTNRALRVAAVKSGAVSLIRGMRILSVAVVFVLMFALLKSKMFLRT
jgi:hypothetical protein